MAENKAPAKAGAKNSVKSGDSKPPFRWSVYLLYMHSIMAAVAAGKDPVRGVEDAHIVSSSHQQPGPGTILNWCRKWLGRDDISGMKALSKVSAADVGKALERDFLEIAEVLNHMRHRTSRLATALAYDGEDISDLQWLNAVLSDTCATFGHLPGYAEKAATARHAQDVQAVPDVQPQQQAANPQAAPAAQTEAVIPQPEAPAADVVKPNQDQQEAPSVPQTAPESVDVAESQPPVPETAPENWLAGGDTTS